MPDQPHKLSIDRDTLLITTSSFTTPHACMKDFLSSFSSARYENSSHVAFTSSDFASACRITIRFQSPSGPKYTTFCKP